jgi:hypothetical protein
MSTAPVLDNDQLLRVNFELRKLVRILKKQNQVLLQQNRAYERLQKFDRDNLREISLGKRRQRRRKVN